MDDKNLAEKIRQVFRDLFGSRLIDTLELRHLELRQDYERQFAEKNELIVELRTEIGQLKTKMETYETVLIPLVSPGAKLFNPKTPQTFERLTGPEPGSWAWVQSEWDRKQREEVAAEAAAKENTSGISV